MKMAYERPMMMAEVYQVNSFVSACGDPELMGDKKNIVLDTNPNDNVTGDRGSWYNVPNGWSNNFYSGGAYGGDLSDYNGLTFEKRTEQYSESHDAWQYYWTATSGSSTYYLEYSYGWSTKSQGNDVFVLYKEDASVTPPSYSLVGNGGDSNVDGELNINWSWGGDNEEDYWSDNYDTLIAGIIFDKKFVQKS